MGEQKREKSQRVMLDDLLIPARKRARIQAFAFLSTLSTST